MCIHQWNNRSGRNSRSKGGVYVSWPVSLIDQSVLWEFCGEREIIITSKSKPVEGEALPISRKSLIYRHKAAPTAEEVKFKERSEVSL